MLSFTYALFCTLAFAADEKPTLEVKTVAQETRLDWRYVMTKARREMRSELPKNYDSKKQKYKFYLPKNYDKTKSWPLLLHIPAGGSDWDELKDFCVQNSVLLCEPMNADNNTPVVMRTRVTLDALDDVRRNYNIDTQRTYIGGFSGGGFTACLIAFSLPEEFGGLIPFCAAEPESFTAQNPFTRKRIKDRFSAALMTGTADFNLQAVDVTHQILGTYGIRSKPFVVEGFGHTLPPTKFLTDAYSWLEADLERRRKDAETYPELVSGLDKAAESRLKLAKTLIEKKQVFESVTLAKSIGERWKESAKDADALIAEINKDEATKKVIARHETEEEIVLCRAVAKGMKSYLGPLQAAAHIKDFLKKNPDEELTKDLIKELKSLREELAKKPFVGVTFEGETNKIASVVPGGPAEVAGVKKGDILIKLGKSSISASADVFQLMTRSKPGDKFTLELRRDKETIVCDLLIGDQSSLLK